MSNPAVGGSRSARQGLGASLREAHRLYIRRLQEHLSTRGLTVAQYLHMRVLLEHGPLTQTEISARLGIEKASSTGALQALEDAGLVVRHRDPRDRRRVIVRLSERGADAATAILPFAREIATGATGGVDEEDLATFFHVLDAVIDRLSVPSPRR
jgi:DNA-binding MarR family transcriptional regulator